MDTASWENDAIGAYLKLLLYEWINGPLPPNLRQLAKISGESFTKFKKKWPFFAQKFVTNDDGNFVNIRLEIERLKQAQYIENQREKGVKSGKARANRGSTVVEPEGQPEGNLSFSSSFLEESLVKDSMSAEESADVKRPPCPHEKIIELYHEILPMMARVREPYSVYWNGVRKKHLATRWKESEEHQDLDFWTRFFTWVKSDCPFLLGQGRDGWKADIGWLICPGNFVKVLEGGNRYRLKKQRGRE